MCVCVLQVGCFGFDASRVFDENEMKYYVCWFKGDGFPGWRVFANFPSGEMGCLCILMYFFLFCIIEMNSLMVLRVK